MTNIDECFRVIAQNIKKLRKSYGLTQYDMAKLLDIEHQYYARLERGDNPQRRFTLEKVMMICSLFDVTPNDIITQVPDTKGSVIKKNYRNLIDSILKDLNPDQLEKVHEEVQKCFKNQMQY